MEELASRYQSEGSGNIHAVIAEKRCHGCEIRLILIVLTNFQHGINFGSYSKF